MDSKEAKIVTRTQAGNPQALLSFGWSRLLDDRLDHGQIIPPVNALAAHSSEIGQQSFAGRLHGRYRTGLRFGNLHDPPCATLLLSTHIEVIANEVEERFAFDKLPGTPDGVAVSPGSGWYRKRRVRRAHQRENGSEFIVGVKNNARVGNPRMNYLFDNMLRPISVAIAVDEVCRGDVAGLFRLR